MYVEHIYICISCANEKALVVVFTSKVCTLYLILLLTCFCAIIVHFNGTKHIFSLVKILYLLHCLRLLSLTAVPASNRQRGIRFACYRLSNRRQTTVIRANCVLGLEKCQVCFKRDPVYMGENCSGVF